MSNIKNNNYPTAWASFLGLLTFIHAALMMASVVGGKFTIVTMFLFVWHLIIGVGYVLILIYAYRKRERLSKRKINFIVYIGFVLYIFLSFSGCFIVGPGMH